MAAAQEADRLAREREEAAASPTTTFRTATINVLGDSHTRRGGDKPGFRSGAARMGGVVGILRSQNLDVVGLQEFERPQKAAFNRLAGGWDVFTGTERGRDAIAYRTGIWEYVQGGTRTIPYFHGNPAPLPWVTLRHRETGRVVSFISIHNPTSSARRGNNARHRVEATRREIALVRTLSSGGNPVLLLGDFNERSQAFCMVTGGGDLIAANGGSRSGNCAPPRRDRHRLDLRHQRHRVLRVSPTPGRPRASHHRPPGGHRPGDHHRAAACRRTDADVQRPATSGVSSSKCGLSLFSNIDSAEPIAMCMSRYL